MGKTAYLFPGQGQGSITVGMGKKVWEHFPEARKIFAAANAYLELPLSDLCFFGPEDQLLRTRNAQPASLVVNLAYLAALSGLKNGGAELEFVRKERPDFLAGHSVGYIAALVCAKAITFRQALTIVKKRAELMAQLCEVFIEEKNPGKMVALLGVRSVNEVEFFCRSKGAGIGGYNSESQIVVSGRSSFVDSAVTEILRQRLAKTALDLKAEGPFHVEDMRPVVEPLAEFLDPISFKDPAIPIIGNSRAHLITTAKAAKQELLDHMCKPVLFDQSIQVLRAEGVTHFIEMGHGEVLSNNLKRGLIKAGVAGVVVISFTAYLIKHFSEQKK